ncbi:MAG: putative amt protein [Monoraphidium minutum]|nr:MAG: putative amt protein [Monoraphidium minutum]
MPIKSPHMATMCSAAFLSELQNLLGTAKIAADVCQTVAGASTMKPLDAALRYLASRPQQRSNAGGVTPGDTGDTLNIVFLLFSGYLVFLMQAGFAMLSAGHVRVKNNSNILLKNLLDCAIGTMAWYLLGNGLAFGEAGGRANGFIGTGDFALSATDQSTRTQSAYHLFFFHWAFSAAAATIVAGAVAERITFLSYGAYSCIMSGFVYPVAVHWLWTEWGWLSPLAARPLLGSGAVDFAGGVAVHVVGGTAALIGTYFLGPRVGRFGIDGESVRGYRENNSNLVVLGTFLLWFGWYGFNPGSAAMASNISSAAIVSRTAVTTTLGAGAGGISAMLLTFAITRKYDVMSLCNGVLCGLVAVTPGCGVIDVWAGILVAFLGAGTFMAVDALMLRARLDDVVAAVPLHLGCGVVGTLFVGLFAREEYVLEFYGSPANAGRRWGAFFGGDGRLLACQLIALLAAASWVAAIFVPFFWAMRRFKLIRVPVEQEISGLDASRYSLLTTNELPTMGAPQRKSYM